jgi:monovalent cation:H+ antiporter, CPA1 family
MDTMQFVALIITLSALLAYLNIRILKLPSTIGIMVLSLLLSLILLVIGSASPAAGLMKNLLVQIDFSDFLLDFMLGFLLFAGALHTDIKKLHKARGPIITYATVGILPKFRKRYLNVVKKADSYL